MARRRLTLKRIDPWSVLKFGFVANLALLAIGLLGSGVIWFFIRQLGLVEKVCEIASDVGFVECGVNGGNLFRALLLLGLLGVVVQTGLLVFLAFLHNLISDLVGGIGFTYTEEGGSAVTRSAASTKAGASTPERPRSYEPAGASSSADRGSSASGSPAGGGSGGPSASPPPLGSSAPSSSGSSSGSSGSSWETAPGGSAPSSSGSSSGSSGSSGPTGSFSRPPSSDRKDDDWTRRSGSGDDEWSRRPGSGDDEWSRRPGPDRGGSPGS